MQIALNSQNDKPSSSIQLYIRRSSLTPPIFECVSSKSNSLHTVLSPFLSSITTIHHLPCNPFNSSTNEILFNYFLYLMINIKYYFASNNRIICINFLQNHLLTCRRYSVQFETNLICASFELCMHKTFYYIFINLHSY